MGSGLPLSALETSLESGSKMSKFIERGNFVLNLAAVVPDTYRYVQSPSLNNKRRLIISSIEASSNVLNFVVPGLGTLLSIVITAVDVSGGFDGWYNEK